MATQTDTGRTRDAAPAHGAAWYRGRCAARHGTREAVRACLLAAGVWASGRRWALSPMGTRGLEGELPCGASPLGVSMGLEGKLPSGASPLSVSMGLGGETRQREAVGATCRVTRTVAGQSLRGGGLVSRRCCLTCSDWTRQVRRRLCGEAAERRGAAAARVLRRGARVSTVDIHLWQRLSS